MGGHSPLQQNPFGFSHRRTVAQQPISLRLRNCNLGALTTFVIHAPHQAPHLPASYMPASQSHCQSKLQPEGVCMVFFRS